MTESTSTEYLYAKALLSKMYLSGIISRNVYEITKEKLSQKFR